MKHSYIFLLLIVIVVTACTDNGNNEANKNETNSQALNYETKQEQNNRLGLRNQTTGEQGGYPQSEQKINLGDTGEGNKDKFSNEQSQRISDKLMENKGIRAAQVTITDDKIIVAIMFDDHSGTNDEMSKYIKKEVRKFDSSKQIVVYTDQSYWEQINNIETRPNQ